MINRARLRSDLGNPPGKRGSIGDAINWEWLLSQDMDFWGDELILISADDDFESELTKRRPREYLLKEWNLRNPLSNLVLFKSLTEFLRSKFPDIRLAEEFEKELVIKSLEESGSFASTHRYIAKISAYEDFKESEVRRLVQAFLDNRRINQILGDDDVKAFAIRLVSLAQTLQLEDMVEPLMEWLTQLIEYDLF